MSTNIKFKGSELVAKRWANALMDLLNEDPGICKDDILDDLKEVYENIEANSELALILDNPSVSIQEKQNILQRLFEGKLRPISFKFISLLNSKSRIDFIKEIAIEFQKELENIKHVLRVDITSAFELSKEQKDDIKWRVAEKFHKDIIPFWNVNSEIIGGLIFKINETILDNSIKHKLENLSNNIVKG